MVKKNRILSFLCIVIMLLAMTVTTATASSQGNIFLQCPSGTDVTIYQIADYDGEEYGLSEILSDSGLSVEAVINDPSAATAVALHEYLQDVSAEGMTETSNGGTLAFYGLDMGVWLVTADDSIFKPFIAFIPNEVDGVTRYTVYAAPKIEDDNTDKDSIYVMKKWDDNNDSQGYRPDSIKVDLILDGTVISTAELDQSNAWSFTFEDLEKSNAYSIEEHDVDYYTAKYSGDQENGFIITNIYDEDKLPQTGQRWWPIIVILIAGIACISLGIIEIRGRKNDQEA